MSRVARKTQSRPLGYTQNRKRKKVMETVEEALEISSGTSTVLQDLRNKRLTAEGVRERAEWLEVQRIRIESKLNKALLELERMAAGAADEED